MKLIVKKIAGLALLSGIILVSFTGCVEHRYYHEHHYHTRGWYDNRHESYPAGVNFDIHN